MNNSPQNGAYLHADQPDGNGPLNVTPEREALIERLAAESRAKQQDRFEELPVDKCDACDGDGWVHVWSQDGMTIVADRDCDECSGTGDADAPRSPSW